MSNLVIFKNTSFFWKWDEMIDDDNYEIPVRLMDWVFDVEEWSYEHTTYFEFLERHLHRFIPSPKDNA